MGYNNKTSKTAKRKLVKEKNSWKESMLYLLPILFIIAILPLITYLKVYKTPLADYPWFSISNEYTDFFLYYKSVFFVITACVMIILMVRKGFKDKQQIAKFYPLFIPLGIYAFLAILSSMASKYRLISLTGGYEHFESIWVVLAYCLVVYYAVLFVKTERDMRFLMSGLIICVLIMSFLAITQVIGHDFIASGLGKRLIVPPRYWGSLNTLNFKFDKWVYLTLYNPDFVGSYVALLLPIIFYFMMYQRKLKTRVIYIISFIGLSIALIFSNSAAGMIGIIAAGVLTLVLYWRKYKIILPLLALIIIVIFVYNGVSGNRVGNKLQQITNLHKTEYNLTNIQTKDNEVIITYKHNDLHIQMVTDNGNFNNFVFLDQDVQEVPFTADMVDGNLTFSSQDNRFNGITVIPCIYNDLLSFNVKIDNKDWFFTNQKDNTYYYINYYTKFDKIVTASSAIFTGYESLATKRGYIWSRTIPLMKKHILLGSGVDTFPLVFPQQDYVMAYNSGYENQFISKPHNMFLQMGVESGVLSLIAFLVFYLMYFMSSLRIYMRGHFDNYYSRIGAGILVGTFAYLVTCLANDSMITVAPLFWTFMGLGIAVNMKVKEMMNKNAEQAISQKK